MMKSPSGKLGLTFFWLFPLWCLNLVFSFADVALWINGFLGAECFFCVFLFQFKFQLINGDVAKSGRQATIESNGKCQLGEETEFVRHTNAWKGGHCIWNEEKDVCADHLHFSLEWVVFFYLGYERPTFEMFWSFPCREKTRYQSHRILCAKLVGSFWF